MRIQARLMAGFGGIVCLLFMASGIGTEAQTLSWNPTWDGIPDKDILAIGVDPLHLGTVYAATSNKTLFRGTTTHGTITWTLTTSPSTIAPVSVFAFDSQGIIYAGTTSATVGDGVFSGTYQQSNGTITWNHISDGLASAASRKINALVIDPTNPSTLYIATAGAGVLKKTDTTQWTAINDGLPGSLVIRSLAMDPSDPGILYAGFENIYGVYRGDTGETPVTWLPYSEGLPTYSDPTKYQGIFALSVDHPAISTTTTIYAGVSTGEVCHRADGSGHWTQVKVTTQTINDIALDSNTSGGTQTLYAATNGAGIFRSEDAGASWFNITDEVESGKLDTATKLGFDPVTPRLYAGTFSQGLWSSCTPCDFWAKIVNAPTQVKAGVAVPFFCDMNSACAAPPERFQYSFSWAFGDGGIAGVQFPSHTYMTAGTYNWTLTVTLADSDSQQRCDSGVVSHSYGGTVTVEPCTVVCSAGASPTSGPVPSTVSFSSEATATFCTGESVVLWAFGDGATSAQPNPVHTYSAPGRYEWAFTVAWGGETCARTGTVTACGLECTATVPSTAPGWICIPFQSTMSFVPSGCTGTPFFHWMFGDGSTSSEQSPRHAYAAEGAYDWKLEVTGEGLSCARTGRIRVTAPILPGDCDSDGIVSIGEMQKAINMFLGVAPIECGIDCNGDGSVSIGEVQKAINGFLGLGPSCGSGYLSGPSPALALGTVSGEPGSTVQVPVTLATNGAPVAASSYRVTYDPNFLTFAGARVEAAGSAAAKDVAVNGSQPGVVILGVLGTNRGLMVDGTVASLSFTIRTGATGTATLSGACGAADPDGNDLPTTCGDGSVTLPAGCSLSCTASATPSTGTAPLAVTFAATATPANCAGTPAYSWDFGDGTTSTAQNPSHTYAAWGDFTWSLAATVDGLSCTQTGTVTAQAPAGTLRISGKVTQGGAGLPGVLMTLKDWGLTTTTGGEAGHEGEYAFGDLASGNYRVLPRMNCKRFTPVFLDVSLDGSDAVNTSFAATDSQVCLPCTAALDLEMAQCSKLVDPQSCLSSALLGFRRCLHAATQDETSALYDATLLAISVTRHTGQPTAESTALTITEEGDYFVNLVNGDQVNKETMASSATVDLGPVGRIFGPGEIKQKDAFLVRGVHLTPGEYTLTVEVRSNPGAYLTIVVSDVDFSTLE